MKVISKEGMPPIEFGDKVQLLADSRSGDLRKGALGVVVNASVDVDGDVEVHGIDDWDYVATADLVVLQKFDTTKKEQAVKAVVELTKSDITFISDVLSMHAFGPLKEDFKKLKAEVA